MGSARIVLLSLGLVAWPLVASAAPSQPAHTVDPATHAKADELFRAGRAAEEAGDYKTACEKFAESDGLEPAPGTQLNLGACEEKQGHLLAARDHFRAAVNAFREGDRRRALADNEVSQLSGRISHLTVHLSPSAPPDAKIAVQGTPRDPSALSQGIELDPGRAVVVVTADGRAPKRYTLDLTEGATQDLNAEAGAPLVVAPPPPPVVAIHEDDQQERLHRMLRIGGFAGAGTGAVFLVVGSILGGMALHEASVVKANCSPSLACNQTGVDAASSGNTDGIGSTVTFVAGGVLLAAGVGLVVWTWPRHESTKPSVPSSAPEQTGTIRMAPLVTPSGGGGLLTWSF